MVQVIFPHAIDVRMHLGDIEEREAEVAFAAASRAEALGIMCLMRADARLGAIC